MSGRYHDPPVIYGAYGSGPSSRIAPKLWQGGYPQEGKTLKLRGIDVLVLAAEELQPEDALDTRRKFPGVIVICAPLDDSRERSISRHEIKLAFDAAMQASYHLEKGRRVLVTCQQGLNRSGLITAITLCERYGISGDDAACRVKLARPGALFNVSFLKVLEKIPAKKFGNIVF